MTSAENPLSIFLDPDQYYPDWYTEALHLAHQKFNDRWPDRIAGEFNQAKNELDRRLGAWKKGLVFEERPLVMNTVEDALCRQEITQEGKEIMEVLYVYVLQMRDGNFPLEDLEFARQKLTQFDSLPFDEQSTLKTVKANHADPWSMGWNIIAGVRSYLFHGQWIQGIE